MSNADCECGFDGEWSACFSGAVYGRCEDENCGGTCEYKGDCTCPCHARLAVEPKETP